MNAKTNQYLSIRVGTQWYGIPLESVVEVHHMMLLTEHPSSTPNVIGLMTLRDIVFPIVDLRLCFGISHPEYRLDSPIVTLRGKHGYIGVIIDEADAVASVSDDQQVTIDASTFPYVQGAARLPNSLLLMLDVPALTAEFCMASA